MLFLPQLRYNLQYGFEGRTIGWVMDMVMRCETRPDCWLFKAQLADFTRCSVHMISELAPKLANGALRNWSTASAEATSLTEHVLPAICQRLGTHSHDDNLNI